MQIIEIRPAKAQRLVTPWGLVLTRERPVRVPPDDRLVEYARSSTKLEMKTIDLAVEERRAEAQAKPKPLRRRSKTPPKPSAGEIAPTPSVRSELVTQLGRDTRAVLKGRAEEFGLLVSSGATKAEIKADILAAFDARASSGDSSPDLNS